MINFIFLVVFLYAGFAFGAWYNRKPPVIDKIDAKLVIDKTALSQLTEQMVNDWLAEHGMVWQPKGAVFDPNREIKK